MRSFSHRHLPIIATAVLICALAVSACSSEDETDKSPSTSETNTSVSNDYLAERSAAVAMPKETGTALVQNDYISIDAGNASSGYFIVRCEDTGGRKLKLGVTKNDKTYYYDIGGSKDPLCFPFQSGDGKYAITVHEQVEGDRYATVLSSIVTVALTSEFSPFLLPNVYVNYTPSSPSVRFGFLLTQDSKTDLESVDRIFSYLVTSIKYDYSKADDVASGKLSAYIPNIDDTLSSKKGICFDYASLFAAMLRSEGIPAKLVMGYALPEGVYHAWNMIYIRDVGWVEKEIYSDGKNWQLADATLASTGADAASYQPIDEY
ncbi:MAG: transglutaminase-like domain-containing protein [Oscillospiraceae bacterium]